MLKVTCNIFVFSNNSFINFFYIYKIAKDSSVKSYQNNEKRLPKKLMKNIKSLSKEEKEKK